MTDILWMVFFFMLFPLPVLAMSYYWLTPERIPRPVEAQRRTLGPRR